MALEVPGIRPAVLQPGTVGAIDPFLGFRHRFRSLYVFDLERAPMMGLLERAPSVHAAFDGDVRAFVARLHRWIDALEAEPGA